MDIRNFFSGQAKANRPTSTLEVSCTSALTTEKRKCGQANYDREYDKKRRRLVQKDWLSVFHWLECNEDKTKMWCRICRLFPKVADPTSNFYKESGVSGTALRRSALESHGGSKRHKDSEYALIAKENPLQTPLAKCDLRISEERKKMLTIVFNTAYYCAKEEMAFKKYPSMLLLQSKNGLVIGDNYRTDKKASEFACHIGETMEVELVEKLKRTRFLSVMADGSTDCSILEEEILYIRSVQNGKPITNFVGLQEAKSGDAQGVLKAITCGLDRIGLDCSTLKKKLVCLNLDGAAVNMGAKTGVGTLLKKENPQVVVVHCIAHNLELAMGDALKSCPYVKGKFEETIHGLSKLYQYSPKLRRQLSDVADILEVRIAHMAMLKQIRWISSRERTLLAVLKNFKVIVIHLENLSTGKNEQAAKARGFLKEMKSARFVKFLHLLLDILKILSPVSKAFQSEEILILDLSTIVETALLKLQELESLNGSDLFSLQKFADGNCFEGVEMSGDLLKKDSDMVKLVVDVSECVSKRFSRFFNDKPLCLFNIFDFVCWPSEKKELASYGSKEINDLVNHFSPVLTKDESRNAKEEWQTLKVIVQKICKNNSSRYLVYKQLLLSKPDGIKNILLLLEIMFCISPSTAACERGFSAIVTVTFDDDLFSPKKEVRERREKGRTRELEGRKKRRRGEW